MWVAPAVSERTAGIQSLTGWATENSRSCAPTRSGRKAIWLSEGGREGEEQNRACKLEDVVMRLAMFAVGGKAGMAYPEPPGRAGWEITGHRDPTAEYRVLPWQWIVSTD